MFRGNYVAMITPFKNNKIDEQALEKIIEFQIASGVEGVVPCGTTGESPTLNHQEHSLIIDLTVKIVNKRVKVIAGTGSNSTAEAIIMTNYAKKCGVDGCLIVAPYYNKPTPEGIYQHFKALSECDVPLIIYNIPGRSVINISDDSMIRLATLKNVVGIKDATGDLNRIATSRLLIKKEFSYLTGEDALALGFNAMGGNGIISVTSNIAPKLVCDLQKYSLNGDYKKALEIQDQLTPLHQAMFCETNPIPVKYAASLLGLCSDELRLPLCAANDESKKRIKQVMQNLALI
jgi:4-hydroxy-tetrahydrodipicolinate synthase